MTNSTSGIETREDVVTVASVSAKLIHEKSDPIRAAVDYAVQANENIASNLLATSLNGIDKKGQRMINQAERGEFYAGLPIITIGYVVDDLEQVIDYDMSERTAYPIVVIRENQVFIGGNDIDNPVKDQKYKDTKRIIKKMNIRLKDFYEGILGPEDDPNPDVDNLDDTFFLFGTDLYSSLESTAEYQWNLFDWLEQEANDEAENKDGYIHFSEYQGTENTFECRLQWSFIERYTEDNVFLKDPREGHEFKGVDYVKTVTPQEGEIPPGGPEPGDPDIIPSSIKIQKQTEFGKVETLVIYNPIHYITIDAKGVLKRVSNYIKPEFIGLPPEDEAAGTGAFYVPMIMEIVELATNKHEQIALYDGCILALFAAEITELKWYQTGWFKAIMAIVSIVVQFVPFAGQALAITIQNIMLAVLRTIILSFIFAMIVAFLPKELAILAAAVMVVASIYGAGGFQVSGMPFAIDLVKAVSAIVKQVNQIEMNDLKDEIADFDKSYKEKQQEIRDAGDLLTAGGLDPTLLISAYASDPYEDPSDFYTRTIHITNPGVLSLDAVEQYCENALTLPEYDPNARETIEGTPINTHAKENA